MPQSIRGRRIHRLLAFWATPCLLIVAVAGQLALLRRLDYSKAWLARVSVKEAMAPRDPLALGGLHWDPAPYVQAPSLDSFRAVVAAHCPGRPAFETATCLSDLFSLRFPHGEPGVEFFENRYEPATALAKHLAGKPGHCVTRAGLLATALLAAGFPARVVQLVPGQGELGHNVVEVWSGTQGWTMVDPTFGVAVGTAGGPFAAAALETPDTVALRPYSDIGAVLHVPVKEFYFAGRAGLFAGNVVYPDPWLYTRVGRRSAPKPFQGRFVIVGPRSLGLGLGQPALALGIALSLLALVGWVLAQAAALVVRVRRQAMAPIADPALD